VKEMNYKTNIFIHLKNSELGVPSTVGE